MAKNFVSNKDESVKMFENRFLEACSKVHPIVPLFIFVPVILWFGYTSVAAYHFSIITIVEFIIFGIIIWTITEYVLHRFVFHFTPKTPFMEKIHFLFHGVHHDYPSDSRRLVMPPSVSIPLAALFYFLFYLILGRAYVAPFFVGFIAGYLFYDITHYAIHHFNMHSKFWLAIKNNHMKHHYQNADKGYGVSSAIWDYVFKTQFPPSEKK